MVERAGDSESTEDREHYQRLLHRQFDRVPFADALAQLVADYDGDAPAALATALELQAMMLRAQTTQSTQSTQP